MYKYQEETIEELNDAIDKVEELTEEEYRIHIGWRHTHNFDEENIPIYVTINGRFRFEQQTNMDQSYDFYSQCPLDNYERITLNDDIFLDIVDIIDKIYTDNQKREKFYEKLNAQLKALNKILMEE